MVLVTFALPEESTAFRKLLRRTEAGAALNSAGLRVGYVGVGAVAARARIRLLFSESLPTMACAAGFAGGLDPRLVVGDLVIETRLSDASLVTVGQAALHSEFAPADGAIANRANASHGSHVRVWSGPIVSASAPIESAAEKKAWHTRTGAIAVDMETETLADECRIAGVPFLALRVISDDASSDLPVPMSDWFHFERQRPNVGGLIRFLGTHPQRIAPFCRFVISLRAARTNLARALIAGLREWASHLQGG